MLNLTISAPMLRAVSLAAPSKDIRYYLNGVLVQARKGRILLVATDGHRIHVGLGGVTEQPDFDVIVPIDAVRVVTRAAGKKAETVRLSINSEDGVLNDLNFRPVDGRYPDWRRVIPDDVCDWKQAEGTCFNGTYLADVVSAAQYLGDKSGVVSVTTDGSRAFVRVAASPQFLAVIMSVRADVGALHDLRWYK